MPAATHRHDRDRRGAPLRWRGSVDFWTGVKLAAVALVLWSGALTLFVDVDKLASHW